MMNDSKKEIRKQKSSQAYMQHRDVMENGLYYGQWFDNEGKAVKLICDNVKK